MNLSRKILVGWRVSFKSITKREAIMNKIKKRMPFIFVSLLVSALFTACGASQTEAITFPIQNDITLTQTSTSQPSQTATHVPIAIPIPTSTNTPIPQPTETPLPTLPKPADLLVSPPQFLARLNRGGIGSMAVSPGRDWLAVTSINHLCLYDTVSFKEAWCLLSDAILYFIPPAFSKNENYLAFKQWNGNIVILDWKTGERIQVIETNQLWNAKLSLSPDGSQIAVNLDQDFAASFWNTHTGQRIESISDSRLFNKGWDDILWSPDGTRILSCLTDGEYIIWNSANYKQLLEINGLQITEKIGYLDAYESSCVWSPDSRFIYTHSEHRWLEKWDAATGKQVFSLDVNRSLSSLVVSPDGKWIALADWGIIDTETGEIVKKIDGGYWYPYWLDNNRLLFLSNARYISLRNVVTNEQTDIQLPGYDRITSLDWLPNSRLTTISYDGSLRTWQAQDGQLLEEYPGLLAPYKSWHVGAGTVSPDGSLIAALSGNQVVILDVETGQQLYTLESSDLSDVSDALDFCWSKDGNRIAGIITDRSSTFVLLWDIQSRALLLTLPSTEEASYESFAWSPFDESQFALGMRVFNSINQSDPGTISVKIWDVESKQEIQSIDPRQQANEVLDITWLDANRVIVIYIPPEGTWVVEIWDVGGYRINRFPMDNVVGLSPDGRIIVSINDGQLELIKWETGDRYVINNTGLWHCSLVFSRDMRFLAALSGGAFTLWDVSEFTR